MTTEGILLHTIASLTKTNEEQGRQIAELTEELKKMSAQIAWFQRQMFGRRSERNIAIDTQPGLFDAAEEGPEPEEETVTYTRSKRRKAPESATRGSFSRCRRFRSPRGAALRSILSI